MLTIRRLVPAAARSPRPAFIGAMRPHFRLGLESMEHLTAEDVALFRGTGLASAETGASVVVSVPPVLIAVARASSAVAVRAQPRRRQRLALRSSTKLPVRLPFSDHNLCIVDGLGRVIPARDSECLCQ